MARMTRLGAASGPAMVAWLAVASHGLPHPVHGQEVRQRDVAEQPGAARGAAPQGRLLPPGSRPPIDFALGVQARYTESGVVLTRIQPGSPAERAGLEANDAIVCVAGYQVGLVGGRRFDLGDEIALRTDERGRVNLLAFDHRDRRLANVVVQFGGPASAPGRTAVQGNLVVTGGVRVSPNTRAVVRLLDTAGPNPGEPLAQTTMAVFRRPSLPYRFDLEGGLIQPGRRYALEAMLVENGRALASTEGPVRITLSESEIRVDLTLRPRAFP